LRRRSSAEAPEQELRGEEYDEAPTRYSRLTLSGPLQARRPSLAAVSVGVVALDAVGIVAVVRIVDVVTMRIAAPVGVVVAVVLVRGAAVRVLIVIVRGAAVRILIGIVRVAAIRIIVIAVAIRIVAICGFRRRLSAERRHHGERGEHNFGSHVILHLIDSSSRVDHGRGRLFP
jgi:hypothetical protein